MAKKNKTKQLRETQVCYQIENPNNLLNRITVNPKVMVGKPVIRGLRITVEQILKSLAAGISIKELLQEYPELEPADIRAVLLYATKLVHEERVFEVVTNVQK